jgi:hypothetical protein
MTRAASRLWPAVFGLPGQSGPERRRTTEPCDGCSKRRALRDVCFADDCSRYGRLCLECAASDRDVVHDNGELG